MILWQQKDLERFLSCTFSSVDWVITWNLIEARFSSGSLHYLLQIEESREWVQLRSDPVDADQPAPAFEITFRCDRIRVLTKGDICGIAYFEFSDGAREIEEKHLRLAMEKPNSDRLYVWPILGSMDKPHPSFDLD